MGHIMYPTIHYLLLLSTNTTMQWIISSVYSNRTTSTIQLSYSWRSITVLMDSIALCHGMVTATTQWTTLQHNLDRYQPPRYSICAKFSQSFHHLVWRSVQPMVSTLPRSHYWTRSTTMVTTMSYWYNRVKVQSIHNGQHFATTTQPRSTTTTTLWYFPVQKHLSTTSHDYNHQSPLTGLGAQLWQMY